MCVWIVLLCTLVVVRCGPVVSNGGNQTELFLEAADEGLLCLWLSMPGDFACNLTLPNSSSMAAPGLNIKMDSLFSPNTD